MTYISLPKEDKPRRLVFYLAMEEYVANHLGELLPDKDSKEAFFMWQVEPTVIFGRNQVMEAEVNIDYCKNKGINLFRRKSGGGCVYSDLGNIMLSYISNSTDVVFTFEKFLQRVSLILRNIGLNTSVSGRNDICIDGKKISGNAFFKLAKSSIVHGTMLFDSNFDELSRAITPSEAKIRSKGVDSVRQHVTNLRPYFEASPNKWVRSLSDIDKFKEYITTEFCGLKDADNKVSDIDSVILNSEQIKDIELIENSYLQPGFLEGRNHAFTTIRSGRIDKVGEICLELDMNGDKISKANLKGDFFTLKEGINEALTKALEGHQDSREEFNAAINGICLNEYISGLNAELLTDILYNYNSETK